MRDSGGAGEPVFRRGGLADAEAVLPVLQSAFPQWPPFEVGVPALEHLRWKMTPPPGFPADSHAIVEVDGEVVAAQLRWLAWVHVRGERHLSDTGADHAVHESAQGRGIGRLMRTKERERVYPQQIVGFDTGLVHEKAIHMQEVAGSVQRPLNVWVRAFSPRAFAVARLRRGGLRRPTWARVRAAVRLVWAGRSERSRATGSEGRSEWEIEVVSTFDDRATALWEEVREEYALARQRDAGWLNWRYGDPRAGLIRSYAATEAGRLLGYASFKRNGAEGTVLDLVTAPGVAGVGAELLEQGARDLREAGCTSVRCLLPAGHREEAALRSAGFLWTGGAQALVFQRARHEQLPEVLEVAADLDSPIHVMLGDFDHA